MTKTICELSKALESKNHKLHLAVYEIEKQKKKFKHQQVELNGFHKQIKSNKESCKTHYEKRREIDILKEEIEHLKENEAKLIEENK